MVQKSEVLGVPVPSPLVMCLDPKTKLSESQALFRIHKNCTTPVLLQQHIRVEIQRVIPKKGLSLKSSVSGSMGLLTIILLIM